MHRLARSCDDTTRAGKSYALIPTAVVALVGSISTRVFFTVTLVEQLDCKKTTSIRCDGFLYFRSEGGVEKCGSGDAGQSAVRQN